MQAKTLRNPVEFQGPGLHSGQIVRLSLKPEHENRGIRFIRTDLPGAPPISSRDIDPNGAPFRTALRRGSAGVHTVEHLLSALAGSSITDCTVEIDGLEVPGLDGSALSFTDALQRAGHIELPRRIEPIVIHENIAIQDGPASIEARPFTGGLRIDYTLDYPGHPLAQGMYSFEFSEQNYLRDIAPARTFAIRPEAEKMRAAGLGKGANTDNTIIVDGATAIGTTLRFPDEPVRHKILDLIGDLYVLGRPLHAHIVARYSGHRANRMLAQALTRSL